MKISIVGAGHVATHFSIRLQQLGFEIAGVFSRTQESAQLLADKLGGVFCTTSIDRLPKADICLVALTDGALQQLCPQIVKTQQGKALFLHTAGSVDMNIWKENGASRYGVLYPMQTFSKNNPIDWKTVTLFVEAANSQDTEFLLDLGKKMSQKVYPSTSAERLEMHLAAVFCCNFINSMFDISSKILTEIGLPFDIMYPLIDETVRKSRLMPPAQAQTGPAVRGDRNVMDKHLALLENKELWSEIYKLISKNIQLSK